MAEETKKINQSSDKKRFIKVSIDVTKINKDWLHVGEKGVYLNATLMMLPDGETDAYGNLGMIIQDVPTSVFKEDKTKKGIILGNGAEFAPKGYEGSPGQETGTLGVSGNNDLPF